MYITLNARFRQMAHDVCARESRGGVFRARLPSGCLSNTLSRCTSSKARLCFAIIISRKRIDATAEYFRRDGGNDVGRIARGRNRQQHVGRPAQPGDLFGSGTISAPDTSGYGSFAELSFDGRQPLTLASGEQRAYLEDGDELVLRAQARREGFAAIGFGDCHGTIVASL